MVFLRLCFQYTVCTVSNTGLQQWSLTSGPWRCRLKQVFDVRSMQFNRAQVAVQVSSYIVSNCQIAPSTLTLDHNQLPTSKRQHIVTLRGQTMTCSRVCTLQFTPVCAIRRTTQRGECHSLPCKSSYLGQRIGLCRLGMSTLRYSGCSM